MAINVAVTLRSLLTRALSWAELDNNFTAIKNALAGAASDADLASTAAGKGAGLVGYAAAAATAINRVALDKLRETVSIEDFGGDPTGVADSTAAFQAAVDYVWGVGGGTIVIPRGTFNILSKIDCYKGLAKRIRFVGAGRYATTITTTADITLFEHAEQFEFYDAAFVQAGVGKSGTALSTTTTKQAAFCRFERLNFDGFRYGQWWRYSIWNTVKDVRWIRCGVGLKASRNAQPVTSNSATNPTPGSFFDTNPAAPGGWNNDPGFFHNKNRFELCVVDNCEAGIWGSFHTSYFDVTTQNGSGTGASNTVVPTTMPGVGIWLQNSGSGTSTFGVRGNEIGMYSEFVQQPIVMEYVGAALGKLYAQGSGSSGSPYEQIVKVTGGILDGRGADISGTDYFKYKVVCTDGTVYGDFGGSPTIANELLSGTGAVYSTTPIGTTTSWSITGAGSQPVATAVDRNKYIVYVSGLYNGSTVIGGTWEVDFHQSGFSRVSALGTPNGGLGVSVSGATISVTTSNALAHNYLRATVVRTRLLGGAPFTG